jgi:hypothetical protein
MQDANNRVFGTIFYGQDVVGEYLQTHLNQDERYFMMGSSQEYASCTYSRHRCGSFRNLTEMIELEKKFNIRYLQFGPYDLSRIQSEQNDTWNYIQNNYKIKLIGAIGRNNQLSIVNVLLVKGGKFNMTEMQTKKPEFVKNYDTKFGDVPLYLIENT